MAASSQQSLSLGDLASATRRRWVVAMPTLLVCILGSLALGQLWPVSYQASATVAVLPMALPTQGTQAAVNMATEQVIVTSGLVASRAADLLGGPTTARELQRNATVTVPPDSDALQIDVTASTPQTAARGANALASAYLSYRGDQGRQAARDLGAGLKARIAVLVQRLAKQSVAGKRANTIQDITNLRSQERGIAATVVLPGELVSAAVAPSSPSSPGLPLFLAAGLVAGALLAFGAAILRDRLDRKVRSADRLDRHLPCRVVDSRGEPTAAAGRRVALMLAAARASHGDEDADAVPLIAVPTARAARTPLLQRLQRARSPYPVAVTAMTGRDGVAAAVAANGAARGVAVICLADDRLSEVTAIVAELETWSSRADVVVIAEPPSSNAGRLRRLRRLGRRKGSSDGASAAASVPREARLRATRSRAQGGRR